MSQQWPGTPVGGQAAPANGLPTAPMPFPVKGNPARQQQMDDAATRTDLAGNADARAAEALRNESIRLGITVEEAAARRKALQAKGGVDSTVEEAKAAGLTLKARGLSELIKQTEATNPEAVRPTLQELAAGVTGSDFLTNAAIPPKVRSARIQLNNLYSNLVQTMIYQASGAAFQQAELDNLMNAVKPNYWDDEQSRAMKWKQIEIELAAAMMKSGAMQPQVESTLAKLREGFNSLPKAEFPKQEVAGDTNFKLSDEKASVPIPPEMQQEHLSYLESRKPGELNVDEYMAFRQALDNKYGFGAPLDPGQAQEFVNAFNRGQPFSPNIPPKQEDLGTIGKAAAAVSNSPGGTAALEYANSMTAGIPAGLSGRGGRQALEVAREENPNASAIGDAVGGIAPGIILEKLAMKYLPKVGTVGSEVLANTLYGTTKAANEANAEDRLGAVLQDGVISAASPIAARGAVKGARGFMAPETVAKVDQFFKPQQFDMPPERIPLPADDITPAAYQGYSDDLLRQELANSQRGIDVLRSASARKATNAKDLAAIEKELADTARANRNKQELFVKERVRSNMTPEQVTAIRNEAAQTFPTDEAALRASPAFADRLGRIKEIDTSGLPSEDILTERSRRLETYLSQNPEPGKGTIPPVDGTVLQRAGATDAEEFIQGFPGVHGGREKSMGSFNQQNAGRMLAKVGVELDTNLKPGQATNAWVNEALNKKYNTLRPSVKGQVDTPFRNAYAAIQKGVLNGANQERQDLWNDVVTAYNDFAKSGNFNGEGFREFSSRLLEISTKLNKDGTSLADMDVARAAEKLRAQGLALVKRNNPAVYKQLRALDDAWAQMKRIEAASNAASSVANRGIYAPDDYLAAIKRLDTSTDKGKFARGQAYDQEYAQNAREILGGRAPTKASLQQTAVGTLVGGTAVVPAAIAMYTPGIKRIAQAIVDGKLGGTVDQISAKALKKWPKYQNIPNDVLRQSIIQALRTKYGYSAEEDK